MNATEYQKLAARTLVDKPGFVLTDQEHMAVWNALGLAGEAGEVADEIKKAVYHRHGINIPKVKKEIGDVLWYAAAVCTTLGLDLGEIMQANIDKLKERYPNGFNTDDSLKRVDVKAEADPDPDTYPYCICPLADGPSTSNTCGICGKPRRVE